MFQVIYHSQVVFEGYLSEATEFVLSHYRCFGEGIDDAIRHGIIIKLKQLAPVCH